MTALCPTCAGPRMLAHPSGFTWQHTNACALRAAEDATRVADGDRLGRSPRSFTRPATATEQVLLAACGVSVPQPPTTTVRAVTPSVLRRTFGLDLDPTTGAI